MQRDVQAILDRHRLSYHSILKAATGFRNEVFLTEQYVVKKSPAEHQASFLKERWFYETAALSAAPRLVATGEDYLILERVQGTGLYRAWRDFSDARREETVRRIAGILREIDAVEYHSGARLFHIPVNWQEDLLARIDAAAGELLRTGGIPTQLATRAMAYAYEHVDALQEDDLRLVYADLHFDNLVVTDAGDLCLLDYEMLQIAPRDYVLDVWQRMTIHPFTYANEEDHEKTHPRDYVNLIPWLRKYAPEVFAHPRVRERVAVYGLLYEMKILQNYPNADWPIERMEAYLDGMTW
jgi:hypothetical protein